MGGKKAPDFFRAEGEGVEHDFSLRELCACVLSFLPWAIFYLDFANPMGVVGSSIYIVLGKCCSFFPR